PCRIARRSARSRLITFTAISTRCKSAKAIGGLWRCRQPRHWSWPPATCAFPMRGASSARVESGRYRPLIWTCDHFAQHFARCALIEPYLTQSEPTQSLNAATAEVPRTSGALSISAVVLLLRRLHFKSTALPVEASPPCP